MLDRRAFLALSGATLLSGCGGAEPPGPATVNLAFTGGVGMNPGPDGVDRPVTVAILKLRDVGAFDAADVFALQADPAAALGADLVAAEQVVVAPGGIVAKSVIVAPDIPYLGLAAFLRAPTGRAWRATMPVSPGATIAAKVALGPPGVSVAAG